MAADEHEDSRSSFGRVVENLDAIVRRHPAGSALRDAEAVDSTTRSRPDNVVDLRSRLTPVRSGSLPDDAA